MIFLLVDMVYLELGNHCVSITRDFLVFFDPMSMYISQALVMHRLRPGICCCFCSNSEILVQAVLGCWLLKYLFWSIVLVVVIILQCFYIWLNTNLPNGWMLIGSFATYVSVDFACTNRPPRVGA